MIFRKVTAFCKFSTRNTAFRFTQPHFIMRRWVVNRRVIRDELIIIEIHIMIRVKEVVANIINQGIIATAKPVSNKSSKTKCYCGDR